MSSIQVPNPIWRRIRIQEEKENESGTLMSSDQDPIQYMSRIQLFNPTWRRIRIQEGKRKINLELNELK